jgi:gamma-glutamyltranspeptidase/glutathione hydrolase
MIFSYESPEYHSRRSPVLVANAAVATSQPLATHAGVQILLAGGNAADAAVAVAAVLQVTQPCSTGLGGDAFFIYYDVSSRRVLAYNGSGRSPARLTRETATRVARGGNLPDCHPYTVTVPGAADAWCAAQGRFGRLDLAEVLAPAIACAREGFPVAPLTARWWHAGVARQLSHTRYGYELMIGGRAPRAGELFSNPGLAAVLAAVAEDGTKAFYRGWIAERIVDAIDSEGGVLSRQDLADHSGEWVDPIGIDYHGHMVWECPPNGQGVATLLALNAYSMLSPSSELERVHGQIEAMRLGFADAAEYVADPDFAPAPLTELLSASYGASRAAQISFSSRIDHAGPGIAGHSGDDTVYFAVVDEEGNGCSFINSNFMGFGTGIVPKGCGFSLQNRGRGFTLHDGHPNTLAPRKRPYHTIIPAMVTATDSGDLEAVFGVMGGMMQPQGHLQTVTALCDGVDPQTALDRPRFQIVDGSPDGRLLVEDSMPADLIKRLRRLGHSIECVDGFGRSMFGLGQIIARGDRVWWCGSDPRGDGAAAGY